MKKCSRCKKEFELFNFNRQSKSKDGYGSYCRECVRNYRQENSQAYRRALIKYRSSNKEEINRKARITYSRNREVNTARTKQYNILHKQERSSYGKLYAKTIKGSFSIYQGNAKAKQRIWFLTLEEFQSIVLSSCYYCGEIRSTGFHGIDRVNNSLGYTQDNCVSCCKMCNYMKKNYSLEEFLNKVNQIAAFTSERNSK